MEGSGISSQIRSCKDYAERRGYLVDETFSDSVSGKISNRPGLSAILEWLAKYGTENFVIVVDDISRLARDVPFKALDAFNGMPKNLVDAA